MANRVHVFVGRFGGLAQALVYTEAQWSADDEPSWRMREGLGVVFLDEDFIETITELDRWTYLEELLTELGAAERLRVEAGDADTLVLIFEPALGGFEVTLGDRATLRYLGAHPCRLG